ncbi:MAG: HD domain-containing protein [Chloroflexota bacterium]
MSEIINEIFKNMRRNAHMEYGERVSIVAHSFQTAVFAEEDGADDLMIAAAFLHDYGHFIHDLGEDIADHGIDAIHEELGAEALNEYFVPEVIEPMRLHVAAKRYLVATDEEYVKNVSPASMLSLKVQGGPFDEAGIKEFEANPYYKRAIQLRLYDEAGKIPEMETPDYEHYRPFLEKALR